MKHITLYENEVFTSEEVNYLRDKFGSLQEKIIDINAAREYIMSRPDVKHAFRLRKEMGEEKFKSHVAVIALSKESVDELNTNDVSLEEFVEKQAQKLVDDSREMYKKIELILTKVNIINAKCIESGIEFD